MVLLHLQLPLQPGSLFKIAYFSKLQQNYRITEWFGRDHKGCLVTIPLPWSRVPRVHLFKLLRAPKSKDPLQDQTPLWKNEHACCFQCPLFASSFCCPGDLDPTAPSTSPPVSKSHCVPLLWIEVAAEGSAELKLRT